jgi:hypothetical protein
LNIQSNTAKYVELSNRAYALIVDTFDSAVQSRLSYWKSVWEIASRPYRSATITSAVGENFDRASALANLTVGEFCSRVQRTADFSEKFLAQVGKLQDAVLETYRDSVELTLSTVDQVKEASAELSVDGVSTVDQVKDASAELSVDGVSTVDQVKDASAELSVDRVSTVDQVKDASAELSVDGDSTVDQAKDASAELSVDPRFNRRPSRRSVHGIVGQRHQASEDAGQPRVRQERKE